jgi:hypothetical protein
MMTVVCCCCLITLMTRNIARHENNLIAIKAYRNICSQTLRVNYASVAPLYAVVQIQIILAWPRRLLKQNAGRSLVKRPRSQTLRPHRCACSQSMSFRLNVLLSIMYIHFLTCVVHVQVKDDGKPLQTNQGKWPFNLEEGVGIITLTLSIGRFMRMENIQIDVHTSHIHMVLKVRHSFAALQGFA